jgi:hypothetical protein
VNAWFFFSHNITCFEIWVIYVIILICSIVARGTLCCNGQGHCDWGPNPSQGFLN